MLKKIDVITSSTSILAGLTLSALTSVDVNECTTNLCIAQYYILEITTLAWILAFSLAFVFSVYEKESQFEWLLRVLIYMGFTGMSIVLVIDVLDRVYESLTLISGFVFGIVVLMVCCTTIAIISHSCVK